MVDCLTKTLREQRGSWIMTKPCFPFRQDYYFRLHTLHREYDLKLRKTPISQSFYVTLTPLPYEAWTDRKLWHLPTIWKLNNSLVPWVSDNVLIQCVFGIDIFEVPTSLVRNTWLARIVVFQICYGLGCDWDYVQLCILICISMLSLSLSCLQFLSHFLSSFFKMSREDNQSNFTFNITNKDKFPPPTQPLMLQC